MECSQPLCRIFINIYHTVCHKIECSKHFMSTSIIFIGIHPFIHMDRMRHCESQVSWTQHNVPGQGSSPDPLHALDPKSHPLIMHLLLKPPYIMKKQKSFVSSMIFLLVAWHSHVKNFIPSLLPSFTGVYFLFTFRVIGSGVFFVCFSLVLCLTIWYLSLLI